MSYCKPHWSLVLGLLGSLAFVGEFLWQFVLPTPELQEFHLMMLKTYVLGFTGLNFVSFVLGVVEWFICGAILGALATFLSNCCKCTKGGCGECGGNGCGHCQH